MASNDSHDQPPSPPQDLSASGLTIPSDSEAYSSLSPPSSSPPRSSNNNGGQPVIIYQAPTFWSILRGAAINLLLPFINGMMLGFGELLAHELAFRIGWSQTNVRSHVCRSSCKMLTSIGFPVVEKKQNHRTRCRDEGGSCGATAKR